MLKEEFEDLHVTLIHVSVYIYFLSHMFFDL